MLGLVNNWVIYKIDEATIRRLKSYIPNSDERLWTLVRGLGLGQALMSFTHIQHPVHRGHGGKIAHDRIIRAPGDSQKRFGKFSERCGRSNFDKIRLWSEQTRRLIYSFVDGACKISRKSDPTLFAASLQRWRLNPLHQSSAHLAQVR